MKKEILIFGAGPIGCCYALLLARAGWNVTLIERREIADCCRATGRSVNMVLGSKGWAMLKALGYKNEIQGMVVPMVGRRIHDRLIPNSTKDQPYGKVGQSLDSINRSDLNALLIKKAIDEPGVTVKFNTTFNSEKNANPGQIVLSNGETVILAHFDLIIGADGINSTVRDYLTRHNGNVMGVKTPLNYGYIEIDFPASKGGEYILPKNHLHIWPLGKTMLIALPNPDSTFTGGLFAPFTGENSFEDILQCGIENFYTKYFPNIKQFVPDIVAQHTNGKVSGLSEVRFRQWHSCNVVLVGDAAHAVTPFLGQGMNFGMYLCQKLCSLLVKHPVSKALTLYEEFKAESNLLADWSLANFKEMANTDNADLNLRKKIEGKMEDECPGFASFHSMVCFRNTPYLHIGKIMEKQDEGFAEVLKLPGIHEHWDNGLWNTVKELMLS